MLTPAKCNNNNTDKYNNAVKFYRLFLYYIYWVGQKTGLFFESL